MSPPTRFMRFRVVKPNVIVHFNIAKPHLTNLAGTHRRYPLNLRHSDKNRRQERQRLAEIELDNEAVSTSSSAKQFFRYQGHRYSHIIDPRSGFPTEGVFSVTVIAPTAAEAELLSTAFFVLGFDEAEKEASGFNSRFSALFVLPVKKGIQYEVKTLGEKQLAQD